MVVEVCYCREDSANQIGGVAFKVGAFAADAVKQFTTEC
jgi:hypothetical protein